METERKLAEFVHDLAFADIPGGAVETVKRVLLATTGTAIAGATQEGVSALRDMLLDQGGKPEATVFLYGDRLPARSAVTLNGVMCRALDYCDAMAPGLHIGSSLVPAALAAAELRGGCDGETFVAALAAGAELASRFNLTERLYDGFDPTGVAGVFGATAAAARILGLTAPQTHNALALAFNRSGGSFQSNVDGSLAVRLIQGWVAETGILCAMLAARGLTGPTNFVDGVYGYAHLFGRGDRTAQSFTEELGRTWRLGAMVFKKYPSCGLTQGGTELALRARAALDLTPEKIRSIEVRLPPYAFRLVGHPFRIGENARVDAQFSIRYCVASAIVRGCATLAHFEPDAIRDPVVAQLVRRIEIVADTSMDARGHASVDLVVDLVAGEPQRFELDLVPGFPGNPLSAGDHRRRFEDCVDYATIGLPADRANRLAETIDGIERSQDVRALLADLAVPRR
jgi:2-methylcitrate dehydratase PrpD